MSLTNKHIVITRAMHQSLAFAKALKKENAISLFYPCIKIIAPKDQEPLNKSLKDLLNNKFDWLIFTSSNAVLAVAEKITKPIPDSVQIAVVGSSTKNLFEKIFNKKINFLPKTFDAETLSKFFMNHSEETILLPLSNLAKPTLKTKLEEYGLQVTAPIAYQTIKGHGGICFKQYLNEHKIDVITFASPSAAQFFCERLQDENIALLDLAGIHIACIGHTTEKTAKKLGLDVKICPQKHTEDDLINAMKECFS